MTKRERVIAALNHKETDIIPFHADFTIEEYEKMAKFYNDSDFLKKLDSHLNYEQYCGFPTEMKERPNFFKDDFNAVWNRTVDKDIGVITEPFVCDLDDYRFPNVKLDEQRIRKECEKLIAQKNDRFTFYAIGFSMFERAWSLCGMENVLMAMITDPETLDRLLDDICEYNLRIIDIAMEYDFDGFYFGDDWGQQHGLIMGAQHWRRFIKPRMKRMYERVKSHGKYVLQHSCGDIEEIFPDLIEIGLDCYQTFQPEIYDIEKVKEKYGDRLSFWGGISTQQLLPYASPEKVKEETARIMKIMGKNGGYIAAPTHAVPHDVPAENIDAMFEVFKNQDKYLK